jgi:hypothetical protein
MSGKYLTHKYAFEDDVDVSNFYDKLPKENLALTFDFELDVF